MRQIRSIGGKLKHCIQNALITISGDLVAKVKQINSQSDLMSMSNFAGPSYLTIIS